MDSEPARQRVFSSSLWPELTASPRSRSFSGLTTLSRRLKAEKAEVQALERETARALSDNTDRSQVEEEYLTARQRVFILPQSLESEGFKELTRVLLEWVNSVLHRRRVIVTDIAEDFHDGQVCTEMLEELEGDPTLSSGTVPLSRDQMRNALERALVYFANVYTGDIKWRADAVRHRDLVQTMHLLVAMARHYRCPIKMPNNVSVNAIFFERQDKRMAKKNLVAELTGVEQAYGATAEAVSDSDVFDRLFLQAPDRVNQVEQMLMAFVSKLMSKIGIQLHSIGKQFMDGLNLIYLMSLLEGYFVPLCLYHVCPISEGQRLHNITLAFDLMRSTCGLPAAALCSPEMIASADRKATMRVLYMMYHSCNAPKSERRAHSIQTLI